MTPKELDRKQRDEIVQRIYSLEASLYPADEADELPDEERPRVRERMYAALAEYADRLPRMRLSVCPYCQTPLKRTFDPFGLDGPWWHLDVQVKYEEPSPCEHFRVLLGALYFGGREPVEAKDEVRPGPEAPFVVPALLALPGMICVVGRIKLATGDSAFPLAYFCNQPTRPAQLHQPWLRNMFWFKTDSGDTGWATANSLFEFELGTFVQNGQLRWVNLEEPGDRVYGRDDGPCPFDGLPGDHERQQVGAGKRALLGLPTGEILAPFED